jgi:hypothetical protein
MCLTEGTLMKREILMPASDLEQKLLNLITDLDRFSQEKRFPSRLNIFEAAGMHRQEIRHSNFLAFLLRPQESHGLGDAFLKRLLHKALDNASIDPLPIRPLAVALGDFSDALVRREWRNIDLLVESKNNNLVFVIENKIDSTEREKQLSKYYSTIGDEYPNYRKLFSYLTKESDPASDDLWSDISYSDVIDALQEARSRESHLSDDAKLVIDHYVSLVRRNIVPDQDLIEQCRRLYAQHKDALDLIFQYGEADAFSSAANLFFKTHTDLKALKIRSGAAVFLPATLFEIVPPIEDTNWWGQSRPLLFWFNFRPRGENKIGLVLEVGSFPTRKPLVEALLTYFKIGRKPKEERTRVYSAYKKLTDDEVENEEDVQRAMNSLWESAKSEHLSSVVDISRRFFKKIDSLA